MDTITLAGPLEAKLRAIKAAGFTQVMLNASDIVGYEMYDVSLHNQGGLVLRPEGRIETMSPGRMRPAATVPA